MNLLAIDTCTENCSVALRSGDTVIQRSKVAPREHANLILPYTKELLDEAGIALSDLDAVAVTTGPGAFTGVRIGLGVAQGLAFAGECSLIGVSSLAVCAQGAIRETSSEHIAVAFDARMGEVYWGCYEQHGAGVALVGEEVVLVPNQVLLPSTASVHQWLGVGSGWQTYRAELTAAFESSSTTTDDAQKHLQLEASARFPEALDLLALAEQKFTNGDSCKPHEVEPVYLRNNVAKKSAEQGSKSPT